jgi:hypothetical protein
LGNWRLRISMQRQSAFGIPPAGSCEQSAFAWLRRAQSAMRNPQSAITNPQSAIRNPQFL